MTHELYRHNFYEAVNVSWLRETKMPDSHSRYGQFDALSLNNIDRIKSLLEELDDDILKPLYNAAMQFRPPMSIDDLKRYVQSIEQNMGGHMLLDGFSYLFLVHVTPDLSNNQHEMVYVDEPQLSLPNRHYYNNPKYKTFLDQYVTYLHNTISKYNLDISASSVLKIEHNLVKLMMNKEDKRNVHKIYNVISLTDVNKMFDITGIMRVFASQFPDIRPPSHVVVTNPHLLRHLHSVGTEKEVMDFLKWSVYNTSLPHINDETERHHFEFYGKVISGVREMKPKHVRVTGLISSLVDDLLGLYYGNKYYTKEVADRVQDMILHFKTTMHDILKNLAWMSNHTKQAALTKLDKMKYKIGIPSKIKDYSGLKLSGNLFNMIRQISRYTWRLEADKLGKPSDPDEWEIGAHEVNAYYSLVKNEIVFPAGILQPPFFDVKANDEVIYGALGAVLGHEISHGFDDQGKKFDANGKLHNWWCPKDKERYDAEANKMIQHFNNLDVEGQKANGKLTLGENLADLGGVNIALTALEHKKGPKNVDYHSFFTSYATLWRQIIRPEEIAKRIKSDPHSLAKHRVNEILKHVPQFYSTYKVQPQDGMYLNEKLRVKLWY